MTPQTPTQPTWPILDRAHGALRTVVRLVPGGGWQDPTPCEAWSVAQVFQHAIGDQQGYAATLTGSGFPSYDPFAPSGELGGNPSDLLEAALAASATAFGQVGPDDRAVPVPLPQGPLAAWVAVGACALDAAVHAWDIAVATGQRSPLDDELAAELFRVAREIVEPLRGFAYAPALGDGPESATGDGSTTADGLLRYLGRDPRWSRV